MKYGLKIGRLYIEWGRWDFSKRPYIGIGIFNRNMYRKTFLWNFRLTFKFPF